MALGRSLAAHPTVSFRVRRSLSRRTGDLISGRRLQQILGSLWLLDGLLQFQSSLFTTNLINGIMQPTTQGQPGFIAAGLQTVIDLTARVLVPATATIALVQIALGLCLLFGRFVRPALLAGVGWSLMVWGGGEGFGMLLTGQASALTGAPGPILLYAILGLATYSMTDRQDEAVLLRRHLRWVLAGFWAMTAALQLQPVWWQSHQIAQTIAANESSSTLNGAILNPALRWLAQSTSGTEIPLNVAIVVVALGLAIGLFAGRVRYLRPLLGVSIGLSLLLWLATEGCGQLLSGSATDVDSGPLLVLLALACWPAVRPYSSAPGTDQVVYPAADHLLVRPQ